MAAITTACCIALCLSLHVTASSSSSWSWSSSSLRTIAAERARIQALASQHHGASSSSSSDNDLPKHTVYTVNVDIDHFGYLVDEPTVYAMRVVQFDQWATKGGPILFYTGNEGDILNFAANSGLLYSMAQQLGARVIFAEHRYYGESMPFGKASYDIENLRYLSAEQALGDYAQLITEHLFPTYGKSPIIAFGGSYGGMLAAYMRTKYPHLISGAIAASAPVRAFEGTCDPYAFNQIITNDFIKSSPACAQQIGAAMEAAVKAFSSPDVQKRQQLTDALHMCSVPDTPVSAAQSALFYDMVTSAFVYGAMVREGDRRILCRSSCPPPTTPPPPSDCEWCRWKMACLFVVCE